MAEDPRLRAARYRAGEPEPATDTTGPASAPTAAERAAYVETAIQQAIRRGEFDDLPGAGKPIEGLRGRHDPDWWIRRKIEREQLTGLAPPAIALRTEHAELDARLDRMHRESDVRETLEDFNRRVIEARRQLQGGPPVVTPTREIAAELRAWRERRAERHRLAAEAAAAAEAERVAAERPGWWARRCARRQPPLVE